MDHSPKPFRLGAIAIGLSALFLLSLLGWNVPRTRADSEARSYLPAMMWHLTNYTEVPTSNVVANRYHDRDAKLDSNC